MKEAQASTWVAGVLQWVEDRVIGLPKKSGEWKVECMVSEEAVTGWKRSFIKNDGLSAPCLSDVNIQTPEKSHCQYLKCYGQLLVGIECLSSENSLDCLGETMFVKGEWRDGFPGLGSL